MRKNRKSFYVSIAFTLVTIFFKPLLNRFVHIDSEVLTFLKDYSYILIITGGAWFVIELIARLKVLLLRQYDLEQENNLKSRKVYTQINLLEKIANFIVILFGIGLILLSFDKIRELGIGLFASAGVAGIILGLSAQKIMGTLLAGIQIAITQPFRIEDAVVVEGEWGWIEEINLTYVVVRIWDKRRLVLPSTYFLDKPFQNWTRNSADITGTIFLYTDYNVPFDALRAELTRLLEGTELWDGKANVLQVTEAKEFSVEIRILVSAKNSPTAWDLRVLIREKMIEFIQKNYPESLPRTRVELKDRMPLKPDELSALAT
ncbi:mechanosensitive ion channel family protein [Arcticibacterium luteifluviistationis]|uniref:Mechanosensitive ion channel protein MscS n=1 Tax=Arcticibacterium luteifluviistationis TaxID=1784714 RepID=A0A2Z4GGY0_9BACT|nr:mechanosensitive ion channel family protein [Arcticibacterium luteifluviistationis]AWW00643.1 mechanosensitive ion channel protein MscS [Arcticibacterium luteifluviistationis]